MGMLSGRTIWAYAAVAIHGINDCNILSGNIKIETIQIVNDSLFRNRFRDDNYSALSLFGNSLLVL